MNLVFKLLRKNTSPTRLAGFLVSNLIGLAIIGAGLQFYLDARSIWQRDDSFLKSDYLAINKIMQRNQRQSRSMTIRTFFFAKIF